MNPSMQEKIARLREMLPSKSIAWRVGATRIDESKGQALPYVKSQAIQEFLDDIVGADNWRNSFVPSQLGATSSVTAIIEIYVTGHWIQKSDGVQLVAASGEGMKLELAGKGAYAEAFQRAASMWGIGRYLHDFDAPWVDLQDGKYLVSMPHLPMHLVPEAERVAVKPAAPAKVETVAAPAPATPVKVEAAAAPAPATPVKVEAAAAPQGDDLAAAYNRAAATVDASISHEATATPAQSVKAAVPAGNFPPGLPEGLSEAQLKTVQGLIDKIAKKLPTAMLRNYVRGPKAAETLPEGARQYVLNLLDKADNKTTDQ